MERNSNENLPHVMLCRAGCGFYGNDAFDGMCSKCYKDALKRKQNSSPVSGRASPAPSALSASSTLAAAAAGDAESMNAVSSALAQASIATSIGSTAKELLLSASANITTTPSVETATTTCNVATPNVTDKMKDEASEDGATGCTPGSNGDDSPDATDSHKKLKKNRCHTCKKKIGLTGFECRCGGLYCSTHRYSDKHNCSFDYKEMAQEQIRKNNPVIVGEKIQKI